MAQSIFTPGPSVYNVQAESPVAAVDPGYGAIGQGLSNLGTGLANYMKLSGSGSGGKTGPSRDEVAEWGEGIQRTAGLPEGQQALEYKKLVANFAAKGVNVGNQAFTSIAKTFLGDNPQFTVGEKFENVQEEAMRKSPEFMGLFAQTSLANPNLPEDQRYRVAEQQFMANQARTASLEQAATFAKGVWNAPDGGEAKVLAQAMTVRDFGLFTALDAFDSGGLPASLSSLDNYVARLNAERVKYNGMARLGGVSEEDLKDYNAQIDQYAEEVVNLKATLNNDNVTPALKKVLGEVLGGNVNGLSTIADVVARLSVLESGKLAPDLQIRVMQAIGLSGGKLPTDPKELATVLGNGVSRQILESVTETLGSRPAERPSVLDRFDLGFGTRPTPVEGSVDGQPPAQVTTSVPGTSVVTIEDLANSTDPVVKDLAIKYVNMPPSQLSTQAKTAEIFLLAPPTGPMTKDQSEIFADKAIAFSLGSQSKDKDQPYSARFVNRFWNSPNFLANMENLKTANPSLYGQVKSVLAGHLEKEINVNSKRTETAARKITEKAPWVSYDVDTGRLEINPSFYTRDAAGNLTPNRSTFEEIPPSEKLTFLKDLTENYGGDIQAAALDSYQKLDILKFQFLKVPGYKDVKEFMDRANSTKAVAQAEANLNRDELNAVKLAPETYIRQRANRGTAVSWIGQGEEVSSLIFRGRPLAEAKKRNIDQASETLTSMAQYLDKGRKRNIDQASDALSSIGQAVGDAFTFEGSGRTVTDPETGIVYNQGQTRNQRSEVTLTPTNRMTSAGRRLYETSEGELVSEKTTTVQDPNSKLWYNIPTINNGTMMSVDEAAELYLGKGEVKDVETGRVIQSFETVEEAEDAARARSQELRQGQTTDQGIDISPRPTDQGIDISPRPTDQGIDISPRPTDQGIDISPRPTDEGIDISPRPTDEGIDISPRPTDEGDGRSILQRGLDLIFSPAAASELTPELRAQLDAVRKRLPQTDIPPLPEAELGSTEAFNLVPPLSQPKSTLAPPMEKVSRVVVKGESPLGYRDWNRGTSPNGKPLSKAVAGLPVAYNDIVELTHEDHLARSGRKINEDDPQRLFAIGRYQIIPKTAIDAFKFLGYTKKQKYTPEVQDNMFKYLLMGKRKPLYDYIKDEKGSDKGKAVLEMAKEFASIGVPYDVQVYVTKRDANNKIVKDAKGNPVKIKVTRKKGDSYYGQPAPTTPEDIGKQLDALRELYKKDPDTLEPIGPKQKQARAAKQKQARAAKTRLPPTRPEDTFVGDMRAAIDISPRPRN